MKRCVSPLRRIGVALLPLLTSMTVGALLMACGDDFNSVTTLSHPRPLGLQVRVMVDGEDGEDAPSDPAPGEAFEATMLLGYQQPAEAVQWLMAACVAAPIRTGIPFCGEAPFFLTGGETSAAQPSDNTAAPLPSASITTPDAATVGENDLLIIGAFCAGGALVSAEEAAPVFSGQVDSDQVTPCEGGVGQGAYFFAPVTVARAPMDGAPVEANLNPTAPVVAMVDDRGTDPVDIPLTLVAPAGTPDCRDYPVLSLSEAPTPIRFRLRGAEDEMEPYINEAGDSVTESHDVASFVTQGEFERLFTRLSTEEAERFLEWTPPTVAPTEETLTRLYFVTRDGRGGTAFRSTAFCLVP